MAYTRPGVFRGFPDGAVFVPSNPPIAQIRVEYRIMPDGRIVAEDLTHPLPGWHVWDSRAEFDADCASRWHMDPENPPRGFPVRAKAEGR